MDEKNSSASPSDDRVTFSFTLKRPHFLGILLPVVFALGMSAGYLLWGWDRGAPPAAAQAAATQGPPTRYDVPINDNDPVLGDEDAEITIIEYTDFECPYCRRHNQQVFSRLFEAYPGQIRYVLKDFPLTSIHPNAFEAAEAAQCSRLQGTFWDYHEKLFSMELELGRAAYEQYAEDLGLDVDEFNNCLDEGLTTEDVQGDFDYAAQLGVRSTPTFFINGIPFIGAQPFEAFSELIDGELAGEYQ